ncbi:gamma-butyrobetaine hydroxylase-like domain-containing protein, partial [Enterobacter hormaechei]
FEDGGRFALPAEYLRVSSPSAEVQGHSPAERKVIGGKSDVAIIAVEAVGNYAVKLRFDDMHDTGIYGWSYLYDLGREYRRRWGIYLE